MSWRIWGLTAGFPGTGPGRCTSPVRVGFVPRTALVAAVFSLMWRLLFMVNLLRSFDNARNAAPCNQRRNRPIQPLSRTAAQTLRREPIAVQLYALFNDKNIPITRYFLIPEIR